VAGSISPWVETALLLAGADNITTVDYNPPECSQLTAFPIACRHVFSMKDIKAEFDAVVSYSSLEHDGLGRYGDPINPYGDLAAILELFEWLRPGGHLLLGIPSAERDAIEFNAHRIYGPIRLELLTKHYTKVGMVWDGKFTGKVVADNGGWEGLAWQHQPVFILKRPLV